MLYEIETNIETKYITGLTCDVLINMPQQHSVMPPVPNLRRAAQPGRQEVRRCNGSECLSEGPKMASNQGSTMSFV